jgi:hypothetical protein
MFLSFLLDPPLQSPFPRIRENPLGVPHGTWISFRRTYPQVPQLPVLLLSQKHPLLMREDSMRRSLVRFVTMAVAFVLVVASLQDTGASNANSRSKAIADNTTIQSFNKAKQLLRSVFAGHERFIVAAPTLETRWTCRAAVISPKRTPIAHDSWNGNTWFRRRLSDCRFLSGGRGTQSALTGKASHSRGVIARAKWQYPSATWKPTSIIFSR